MTGLTRQAQCWMLQHALSDQILMTTSLGKAEKRQIRETLFLDNGQHKYLKFIFYTQNNRDPVLKEQFLDNTGQNTKYPWIIFLNNEHRENTVIEKTIKISILKTIQDA